MADVSGVLVLLAIGFALDLIKKARERQRRRDVAGTSPQSRSPVVVRPSASRAPVPPPQTRPLGLPPDWRRVLDEAGPLGRHPDHVLESHDDVEERESLETQPRVRSLEGPVARTPRVVIDLDEESRAAAARRLREAALRDGALTRADHRAFDRKVRQPDPQAAPPPPHAVPTRARLRDAIRWREILDRPVGWRDE